jgi:hypothetical protein
MPVYVTASHRITSPGEVSVERATTIACCAPDVTIVVAASAGT